MALAQQPPVALQASVCIDCPDSLELARFYGALLGWEVGQDGRNAAIMSDDGQDIAFQQVDDYRAPEWPGQEHPQQMHLDLVVADLDAAEAAAAALGARRHEHQPGEDYRVLLDPAGHPFCLCLH